MVVLGWLSFHRQHSMGAVGRSGLYLPWNSLFPYPAIMVVRKYFLSEAAPDWWVTPNFEWKQLPDTPS